MHPDTLAPPRRNFIAGIINGTLFNLVNALMDPSVVLVVFVAHLTDSNFLLGLAGVVRMGAWMLPQIWVSGYIQSLPCAQPVYRHVALLRGVLMLMLVVSVFTVQHPTLLLFLFFALVAGQQFAAGVGGLVFMDVVGKVIPAAKRGVFFSWRVGLGGLLAIGGGAIVRALLDEQTGPHYPENFGVIFALAVACSIPAMLAWMVGVEEPPARQPGSRRGLKEQFQRALAVWDQDANYRAYLQARVALFFVVMAVTPFFTVYAQKVFGVPVATLAVYPAVIAAANLVGTTLSGWASARLGNQNLIRLGAGLSALILVMVLSARPLSLSTEAAGVYFGAIFALVSVSKAMMNISLAALNINIAPEGKRPLYIGFSNTVMGVAMLLGAAAGLLVDAVGFQVFFILALAPTVFGVWQLRTLQDPAVP